MPWSPTDKYLWDFWFAWKGEELHAFYLQAEKSECRYNADARHNLASVGHAVLTPWGWRELDDAPALARSAGRAWDDMSIWTGCVVKPDEKAPYHLFYTSRSREDSLRWTPSEWQRPQQIGLAISRDLCAWERVAGHPVIPNIGRHLGLDGVAWRDPYLLRGADGAWHAFICARLDPLNRENADFGPDAGGAIVRVRSPSLTEWRVEQTQRLVASDEFYQMEVPQVFWREFPKGKRFYLLFCAQEKDCSRARRARGRECETGTYYICSELLPRECAEIPKMTGPARLFARGLYAGKLLRPETAERPVFFGFPWADSAGHFVGGISDPLHARFLADGSLILDEREETS
jgi:beta-fructofuranosidase